MESRPVPDAPVPDARAQLHALIDQLPAPVLAPLVRLLEAAQRYFTRPPTDPPAPR